MSVNNDDVDRVLGPLLAVKLARQGDVLHNIEPVEKRLVECSLAGGVVLCRSGLVGIPHLAAYDDGRSAVLFQMAEGIEHNGLIYFRCLKTIDMEDTISAVLVLHRSERRIRHHGRGKLLLLYPGIVRGVILSNPPGKPGRSQAFRPVMVQLIGQNIVPGVDEQGIVTGRRLIDHSLHVRRHTGKNIRQVGNGHRRRIRLLCNAGGRAHAEIRLLAVKRHQLSIGFKRRFALLHNLPCPLDDAKFHDLVHQLEQALIQRRLEQSRRRGTRFQNGAELVTGREHIAEMIAQRGNVRLVHRDVVAIFSRSGYTGAIFPGV